MKSVVFLGALLLTVQVLSAQSIEKDFPESFQITVSNPLAVAREQVLVVVIPPQVKAGAPAFNTRAFVVMDGKAEISSQYNEGDEGRPGLVFVLDKLAASESRRITVRYARTGSLSRNYTRRTQAELSYKQGGEWKNREYVGGAFHNAGYLSVPPEHKDHSWFIRYEGPGWESDLVGYRFYLDQRNAADVFGKKTTAMVLQDVGQDGFESYHHLQPWGMDILKAGKSLGLGTIAMLVDGKVTRVEKTDSVDCSILKNGPVFSALYPRYFGWQVGGDQYNLRSWLSIHAGTRLTHAWMEYTGGPQSMVTGIVKDKNARLWTSAGDAQHWGYLATYGQQSLNNDNLGLVIFFNPADGAGFAADEYSHYVILKVPDGHAQYYYGAAWEREPGGIQDETRFLSYIQQVSHELSTPVQVRIGR